MTFNQAVQAMTDYKPTREAINVIYEAVEPLCKTVKTDEERQSLYDWLSNTGGYNIDMTAESIASEYDDLGD